MPQGDPPIPYWTLGVCMQRGGGKIQKNYQKEDNLAEESTRKRKKRTSTEHDQSNLPKTETYPIPTAGEIPKQR